MPMTDSFTLGSIFLLAMTLAQPLANELSSVVGIRPGFLFSQILFIAGTITCALTVSSTTLMVARAIQGAGAGAAEPVKARILFHLFDTRTRTKLASYLDYPWIIGVITGPLLGGLFVQQQALSWVCLPLLRNIIGTDFQIALGLLDLCSLFGHQHTRHSFSDTMWKKV